MTDGETIQSQGPRKSCEYPRKECLLRIFFKIITDLEWQAFACEQRAFDPPAPADLQSEEMTSTAVTVAASATAIAAASAVAVH